MLSDKARKRLIIATTSKTIGTEIADAIDDGGGSSVNSVNNQTGDVELNAVDIPYDNTSSELIANNVQAALDELKEITAKKRHRSYFR